MERAPAAYIRHADLVEGKQHTYLGSKPTVNHLSQPTSISQRTFLSVNQSIWWLAVTALYLFLGCRVDLYLFGRASNLSLSLRAAIRAAVPLANVKRASFRQLQRETDWKIHQLHLRNPCFSIICIWMRRFFLHLHFVSRLSLSVSKTKSDLANVDANARQESASVKTLNIWTGTDGG